MSITLQDIFLAQDTIRPIAKHTPLKQSLSLSARHKAQVYLKLETMQETGSFKVRGAANHILSLTSAERKKGVVTVSTGNHGRAVAYVARQCGIPATICLSHLVPDNKIQALRQLGAEIVIYGQSQDEAALRAQELQTEKGLHFVPPFDDAHIIAGQGTIGLELLQDVPQIDTVIVPLSGGGLISGIAIALKMANPAIHVYGVSMERGPAMFHSLQAGHPVEVEEQSSLADSLGGGIGLDNAFTFDIVRKYVDDIILLSEDEIADAMLFALRNENIVVEGAGAVAIATILEDKIPAMGQHIALILSGANIDMAHLLTLVEDRKNKVWT